MTDPRIEAAARALCDLQGYRPDGDEITPTNYPEMDVNWKVYEEEATVALAAADAAAWMPIMEAPNNGTRFWAWFPLRKQAFSIRWSFNIYDEKDDWTLDDDESACSTHDNPTHWQPLPTPPKAQNT